jgi:3-oxoacyl-[acyl-carrier-protein] synthase I
MRRAFLRGAGIATCLGGDLPSNLTALRDAKLPSGRVDLQLAGAHISIPYHLIVDPAYDSGAERLYTLLERVIAEALGAARLSAAQLHEMGIFVGSSSFEVGLSEQMFRRELASCGVGIPVPITGFGRIADRIRERFCVRGPAYTYNTACTSSANALLYASAMLESGWLEHAIVIGTEVFNFTTALGFHGLDLISERGLRPFAPDRSGLVLGEGIGALVLAAGEYAASDPGCFLVRGGANLCDTYGVTAANPDGSSIAEVLRLALDAAQCGTHEIRAIKAHGTASQLNDEGEAAGIRAVFSELPPITALKPYIGHTLGACGVNEIILLCGAVEHGFCVANPGICAEEGPLGIALRQTIEPLAAGAYLFDYFGFGGNNTALILSNAGHGAAA